MKALKDLREEKGLTQAQLGKELGLDQTTISQYERGVREPDFQILKKLRDYFGVTADYLLGFVEYE